MSRYRAPRQSHGRGVDPLLSTQRKVRLAHQQADLVLSGMGHHSQFRCKHLGAWVPKAAPVSVARSVMVQLAPKRKE